jgi:hypothetical protein
MFYKEEDISNELICPKCTNRFVDPRFLPCGSSLCQICILDQVDNEAKTMNKCFCCQENHPLPKEGEFAKNKFIIKLLEKKPIEVKRGALGEQLKKSIITLTDKKEELENYLKSGDQIVSDYLSEIRTQIDIITETQIERLNKARESLLDKLKQYQTDCMNNYKPTNKTEFITQIDLFNEKMRRYLNGADWNEKNVNEWIKEGKNLVDLCSKAKVNFENEIFLNKKPRFNPSTITLNEAESIGKLDFDSIKQSGIVQNVISLNDQQSIFCDSAYASSNNDNLNWISNLYQLKYLKEKSFGKSIKWCYQLSDLKKVLIINKSNLSEAVFVLDINKMQLDTFLNKYNKTLLINTTFHNDYLFLFCQDLTCQFHIFICRYENGKSPKLFEFQGSNKTLLKELHIMAANDNYLYCFCKSIVISYKYDQKTIQKVNIVFTIPVAENAKKIKVDNKFFYVLNDSLLQKNVNALYICNLTNGEHLITINDQNFIDICPIEDGLISVLYQGSAKLTIDVYDVNEKSFEKKQSISLPLQNSNVEFVCFSKDKLLLLDKLTSNMISFERDI